MKQRIAFLSLSGISNFIKPIVMKLKNKGFETTEVYSPTDISGILESNDIIWIEWADHFAHHLTTMPEYAKLLKEKKVICRVHSYESLVPEFLKNINWGLVNDIIFVAPHIYDIAKHAVKCSYFYGFEGDQKRCHIIPQGIDLNKYLFNYHQHGNNIGYAGYINFKKGPMLLMHAFHSLVKTNKDLKLNIAGEFQDLRYKLYFQQMLNETNLRNQVNFMGWQINMEAFYEQQDYIICSSVLEGQCVNIAEAMAMGVKPLIHNFVGAKNMYPKEWIWTTLDDLHALMSQPYESERYRDFVIKKYNMKDTIRNIIRVINGGN